LKHSRLTIALGAALFALLAPLCANADIPQGESVAGIRCDKMEGTAYHIHSHLAINDHGRALAIPDSIGRPIFGQCFYWLHTHTPDGIIHIESPVVRSFTLGQFFAVWGEPLTRTRASDAKLRAGEKMTVWLNGSRYAGDPRTIPLAQHTDITIDVGAPAPKPAPFTAWNGQ
jgi:hypothetical protein